MTKCHVYGLAKQQLITHKILTSFKHQSGGDFPLRSTAYKQEWCIKIERWGGTQKMSLACGWP